MKRGNPLGDFNWQEGSPSFSSILSLYYTHPWSNTYLESRWHNSNFIMGPLQIATELVWELCQLLSLSRECTVSLRGETGPPIFGNEGILPFWVQTRNAWKREDHDPTALNSAWIVPREGSRLELQGPNQKKSFLDKVWTKSGNKNSWCGESMWISCYSNALLSIVVRNLAHQPLYEFEIWYVFFRR